MRRLLLTFVTVLTLTIGLCTAAFAAEESPNFDTIFPAMTEYVGFSDVQEGTWYYDSMKICFETGLMNGTGGGKFSPTGTISVAEVAAISVRLTEEDSYPVYEGKPWYTGAIEVMSQLGVTGLEKPTAPVTRSLFLSMLGAVTPESYLAPINTISALPDTHDAIVLRLYNAGILTGTDVYGTLRGDRTLTRAEVAVMVARIVRPTLRQSFTPMVPGADPVYDLTGQSWNTTAFSTGNTTVPLGLYLHYAAYYADQLAAACAAQEVEFSWTNTVDGLDFRTFVTSHANSRSLRLVWGLTLQPTLTEAQSAQVDTLLTQRATELGGEAALHTWLRGQALTEEGYRLLLAEQIREEAFMDAIEVEETAFTSWLTENGILRAKHILVEDQVTAVNLKANLDHDNRPEYFDELMHEYSIDVSGLASYPDGFTFGPGAMVPAFENAVKNLAIGEISDPVESEFGWHIIQRLQPDDSDYRQSLMDSQFNTWLSSLTDLKGLDFYEKLNEGDFYDRLLSLRTEIGYTAD